MKKKTVRLCHPSYRFYHNEFGTLDTEKFCYCIGSLLLGCARTSAIMGHKRLHGMVQSYLHPEIIEDPHQKAAAECLIDYIRGDTRQFIKRWLPRAVSWKTPETPHAQKDLSERPETPSRGGV
jgi:hypothetical protein